MKLIGCVATYNEADLVAEAINSLWRIGCDRVIVVDGAWGKFDDGNHYVSTDGTQDVARLLGAEVIEAPGRRWHDQPEARSLYLVGEPGDWYIVCDADERCQGWLPDLTSEVEAYLVELRGTDGNNRFSRMRLFRHSGTRLWYQHRHYCVYADGRLIEPAVQAENFWMEHIERTPERKEIKEIWYEQQRANERKRPVMKQLPPVHLGPLEYIGGGAWLPGVPARNLTADETDRHYYAVVANMDSARPIYRLQQSEPEDNPAKSPQKRTQRRKEK
jgi:hypothetical protein